MSVEMQAKSWKTKRAQAFSLDLMVGTSVFLVILSTYVIIASQSQAEAARFEESRLMWRAALAASSALVQTAGSPSGWHALPSANWSSVNSLGLADSRNELNPAKLAAFSSMDYDDAKEILGLQRYEFRFTLTSLNGSSAYSSGLAPENVTQSISVERVALLNGSEVIARLEVWK